MRRAGCVFMLLTFVLPWYALWVSQTNGASQASKPGGNDPECVRAGPISCPPPT